MNDVIEISAVRREIAVAIAASDADKLLDLRSICDGAVRMLASRGHALVKANEYATAKIECEAGLGAMIPQSAPHGGARSPEATLVRLADIGINKSQSSRWQLIGKELRGVAASHRGAEDKGRTDHH